MSELKIENQKLKVQLKQQMLDDLRKDPQTIWNTEMAAAFLGLTDNALKKWRVKGGGPVFVRISGSRIGYRKSDLLAWVETRLHQSTSEPVSLPTSLAVGAGS